MSSPATLDSIFAVKHCSASSAFAAASLDSSSHYIVVDCGPRENTEVNRSLDEHVPNQHNVIGGSFSGESCGRHQCYCCGLAKRRRTFSCVHLLLNHLENRHGVVLFGFPQCLRPDCPFRDFAGHSGSVSQLPLGMPERGGSRTGVPAGASAAETPATADLDLTNPTQAIASPKRLPSNAQHPHSGHQSAKRRRQCQHKCSKSQQSRHGGYRDGVFSKPHSTSRVNPSEFSRNRGVDCQTKVALPVNAEHNIKFDTERPIKQEHFEQHDHRDSHPSGFRGDMRSAETHSVERQERVNTGHRIKSEFEYGMRPIKQEHFEQHAHQSNRAPSPPAHHQTNHRSQSQSPTSRFYRLLGRSSPSRETLNRAPRSTPSPTSRYYQQIERADLRHSQRDRSHSTRKKSNYRVSEWSTDSHRGTYSLYHHHASSSVRPYDSVSHSSNRSRSNSTASSSKHHQRNQSNSHHYRHQSPYRRSHHRSESFYADSRDLATHRHSSKHSRQTSSASSCNHQPNSRSDHHHASSATRLNDLAAHHSSTRSQSTSTASSNHQHQQHNSHRDQSPYHHSHRRSESFSDNSCHCNAKSHSRRH